MVLRKDFLLSVKFQLLVFLNEFSDSFFTSNDDHAYQLDRVIDALHTVVQSPIDSVYITISFREQFMISVTSIVVCVTEKKLQLHVQQIVSLVECVFGVAYGGDLNLKELRKALAFLLEWPQILTPRGMEFMAMVIPVAAALEIQP
ncbi:hypothetical protein Ahy_B03g067853 [Arachis hypogaea]|uniref:Uncharacterized protein n=1 Tax=Arachis hypogaea TaxID=3818 RepID=A0A445A7W2_ARAHY|nr:hypothetical protein Ahy_B03g067853 [Arachis hypogaea]